MKQKEIKELSTADLAERLEQLTKEYNQLKAAHAVTPLESPAKITLMRKDVARLNTELRERQLKNQ